MQLVFLSDLHKERLQPDREATIGRKGCAPADAVPERADDVLMTFVRLPKGTFYMGWDDVDKPLPIKKGVKTEIKEDFEIAVHDVTQGQWQAIMGSNPSYFSRQGNGRNKVLDISDEELKLFPVEQVSWDDAQEFIKKLNEKERGRGYSYRLPTAAEWEHACRGGATSEEECSYRFYFDKPTNDLSSEQANFNGDVPSGKAPKGPYLGRTTRVGAYPSNKLGLCDMHGNVWQWTDSFWEKGRSLRVLPGRRLELRRPRLPGVVARLARAVEPALQPRLPACPSSHPIAGQASRSERPRSLDRRPAVGVGVGPRAAAEDAGRSAQACLLRRRSPPSGAGPARPALPPALRRPVGLRGLRPPAQSRPRPHHAARPLQGATVAAPATSRQHRLA